VNPRLPLLLNLVVLIVTVIVVVAHSDSQERVLRATTRMACEVTAAPSPWFRGVADPREAADPRGDETRIGGVAIDGAIRGGIGQVSHIRLLKYLARVDGLEELSPSQLDAVYEALENCCRVLVVAGGGVRERSVNRSLGGAGARRSAEEARDRAQREVESRLRAAAIPDGELLARLVRVVVSSAG